MPEFTFNPDTGSGEATHNGQAINAGPDIQAATDAINQRSWEATGRHLADRASQREGTDVTQVGGSANLEIEQALQTAQLALHRHETGQQQVSTLEHLRLQSQVQMLAERLVTGDEVAPVPEQDQVEEDERKAESLADLRDTLRNDDGLNKALEWGTETLDENVLNALQLGLNSDDPNKLKYASDQISNLYKNREHVQTVESYKDVSAVSDSALQWFESNYDAETAKNVSLLNYGLRSGALSMGQATQQALQLGVLPAMIAASKELPDFNIANF